MGAAAQSGQRGYEILQYLTVGMKAPVANRFDDSSTGGERRLEKRESETRRSGGGGVGGGVAKGMFAASSLGGMEKGGKRGTDRVAGGEREEREKYRKGGCVSIGDRSRGRWLAFLFLSFQFRSSGSSLRRKTRPTDRPTPRRVYTM